MTFRIIIQCDRVTRNSFVIRIGRISYFMLLLRMNSVAIGGPDNLPALNRGWVAEESDREAVVTACLEAYFECATNEIPQCKIGIHNLMLEFLRIFLFDHRGDVVPEGRNRWEYLTQVWKTGDGDYSLEDALGIAAKVATLDAESDNNMG
jgi:hypothetical protein